jgi:hypothetical protein
LSAALLIVSWLFSVTGVRAELFPPTNSEPPRTCNLSTKVTIVAGLNGDPAAPFPRVVNCPGADCPAGFSGSGQYLRWDYTFMYFGVNPSQAYLTVSDDISLFFTSPTAVISPFCSNNSGDDGGLSPCEVRTIRFNANSTTFNAAYLTGLDWSPRIASAGAKAGNFKAYCLLAGGGKPTGATGQAITQVNAQTPGCTYEFGVGSGGQDIETGSLHITSGDGNCTVAEDTEPLIVDERPVSGWHINFLDPVRTEGSCNYTYTNTAGGKTTISCTTCCVAKSTNKCVLKSALSSPATQCTSGTQ